MNCRVFYHDRCFDGACSAALFTRFHRECIGGAQTFDYRGLAHRPGPLFDDDWIDTRGENAIVDFKYTPRPEVTWWFDHHQSAFATPEDEARFRAGQGMVGAPGPQALRHFFNPEYISCTGWIAHIANTRFGMNIRPLADLIHWANIVDGAKYESAIAAVELAAPAMQLTAVIEGAPTSETVQRFIPLLTALPLAEIVALPWVRDLLGPLLERHWKAVDLLRDRVELRDGVLIFDITDGPTEGYSKFIPYYLQPEATYVVGLSKSSLRVKISVGTNPWTPKPAAELANIASICERWGGGGHPRVGAISFPVGGEGDARTAVKEIVEILHNGQ